MIAPHTDASPATPTSAPARKPRDDEIDVYGLTHPGKVRTENQDHFLICTLRKQMVVLQTSLPGSTLTADGQRLALLMMVADGVGGGHDERQAGQHPVQRSDFESHLPANRFPPIQAAFRCVGRYLG